MEEKYVGQRGPDKETREFNPKSLLNLKQFQKPIPNINSAVNVGINWSKIGIITIFTIVAIAIWHIRNKRR